MSRDATIFIIDYDPELRDSLSNILAAEDFSVLAIGVGVDVLNIIRKRTPAVALIDLKWSILGTRV